MKTLPPQFEDQEWTVTDSEVPGPERFIARLGDQGGRGPTETIARMDLAASLRQNATVLALITRSPGPVMGQ